MCRVIWSTRKPGGQDAENNTSTFVSILGQEGASREMWEHYCLAGGQLQEMPRNTAFQAFIKLHGKSRSLNCFYYVVNAQS